MESLEAHLLLWSGYISAYATTRVEKLRLSVSDVRIHQKATPDLLWVSIGSRCGQGKSTPQLAEAICKGI